MEEKIVNIEESKSGKPTLFFEKDGIKKYVHSKYDPIEDAKNWVKDNIDDKDTNRDYIIFGGGLLYSVYELLNKSPNSKIFVIEPSLEVSGFLTSGNALYSELLANPRFSYFSYSDRSDFASILSDLLDGFNLSSIKFINLPQYDVFFEEMYSIVIKLLKDKVLQVEMDRTTQQRFVLNHMENLLSNVFVARNAIFSEQFKDKFKGKKAIIVSAGPSLEKNVDQLKGNEDKYIIISGGRTLPSLLDRGIEPHFAVSLDPSYANFKLIENNLDAGVPIVLSMLVNKNIAGRYKGEKIFFNNSGVINFDKYFFGRKIDSLPVAGTVATMQLSFAIYLGCDEVAFIGQDLALSDGKLHADIARTTFEKENNINNLPEESLKDFVKVEGSVDKYVYTTYSLYTFARHFEEIIEMYKSKAKFYDCTEGGAKIEGTEVMLLSDFTKKCSAENNDFYTQIKEIFNEKHNDYSEDEISAKIKGLASISQKNINLAKEGQEIIDRQIKNNAAGEKDEKKFKKIDNKILKSSEKIDLATVVAGDIMRDFENLKMDKTKKQEEQIEDARNITRSYYLLLQGIYGSILKFIEKALNEMKDLDKNNILEEAGDKDKGKL